MIDIVPTDKQDDPAMTLRDLIDELMLDVSRKAREAAYVGDFPDGRWMDARRDEAVAGIEALLGK